MLSVARRSKRVQLVQSLDCIRPLRKELDQVDVAMRGMNHSVGDVTVSTYYVRGVPTIVFCVWL